MLNSIVIILVMVFSTTGFLLTFNQFNRYGYKYEIRQTINNDESIYTVYTLHNYVLSIIFSFIGSILLIDVKILHRYRGMLNEE